MAPEIAVVDTRVANLASVIAALKRLGATPVLTSDPGQIESVKALVLPGVGTFHAAMGRLREMGIVDSLKKRIQEQKPTLAICLGLQMLCSGSEESPGVAGLQLVSTQVTRFPSTVRVPQLGWNLVEPDPGCHLLQAGYAYFANSFRLCQVDGDWKAARTDYAGYFIAAIERGPVLACQFHPELSGTWGMALMKRWLDLSREH